MQVLTTKTLKLQKLHNIKGFGAYLLAANILAMSFVKNLRIFSGLDSFQISMLFCPPKNIKLMQNLKSSRPIE